MIPKPTPKAKAPRKPLVGKPHRLPDAVRAVVLAEYPVCQWCGEAGGRLDIHHRLPRSRGGTDHPRNLVALHRKCHRFIHEHPREAVASGFTISAKRLAMMTNTGLRKG